MTRIRLKRIGSKGAPYYRVVVADQRNPRDGKVIEEIGWYNPRGVNFEESVTLKVERAKHWVSVGAQPSDSVRWMFENQGIIAKKEYSTKPKSKAKSKE